MPNPIVKAVGATLDLSDDRFRFFKKLYPTGFYGGFASLALVYYTQAQEQTDYFFIARRFATGFLLYPLSRFVIDYSHVILTSEHFKSNGFVIFVASVLCGLTFGTQGETPKPLSSCLLWFIGSAIIEAAMTFEKHWERKRESESQSQESESHSDFNRVENHILNTMIDDTDRLIRRIV